MQSEKALRNNRNYHIVESNKSGVRFRNSSLSSLNDEYVDCRREYDRQQQGIINEVVGITGKSEVALQRPK